RGKGAASGGGAPAQPPGHDRDGGPDGTGGRAVTVPTTVRSGAGMALVAVLGALLLVSTIVFAMAFVATLDVTSARSSQTAVLAEAQVEGALALAVAEFAEAATADPGGAVPAPVGALGPWPELGIGAAVS